MNRRFFLTGLGTVGLVSLSGCSMPSIGGDTYDPSNVDSDGDGLVDDHDYAPWDSRVQDEVDVFNARWTRDLHTPLSSDDPTPIRDWFSAQNQSGIISRDLSDGQLSRISAYSATSVEVTITEADSLTAPYSIVLLTRGFPQQAIFYATSSDELSPQTDSLVTFDVPELPETTLPIYHTVYAVPVQSDGTLDFTNLYYLHETNPFEVAPDGAIESVPTPHQQRGFETEYTSRTPVEGGYILSLSGRSNGEDWRITYFVSRSAYEYRKLASRGRSREEYARQAVQENVIEPFARLLIHAAEQLGRDTRHEQAEFVIDVIQSFPYVLDDVGTGFDDYTKFAEETLVEMEGDCEDTSVLLAVVLHYLGFEVVLAEFPSHIGVGIRGDFEGAYIQYEGNEYHYIETTAEGWAVGDIPEVLDTSTVYVSAV